MNKENFTHKCNRCKHNFATCKSKLPLFLSDLPNEINEAFPELEPDTVLWCDSYEQVLLREQPLILRQTQLGSWVLTQKTDSRIWLKHLSEEEARTLVMNKNLRHYGNGFFILPSQE